MNNFEIVEFLDYVIFEIEGSFFLKCEIYGFRVSNFGVSLLEGRGGVFCRF